MEDEIHHHFRAAISAIHVSTCSVRRQTSRKASHAGKRRQYKAFGGTKLCGTVKVFRLKIVLVKDQPDMLINIVAAGHVFHRPIKEVYRVVAFARDIQMDAIPVFGINRLFDFLEILRLGFCPFGNDQMIFRRDHLPGVTTGLHPGLAHV